MGILADSAAFLEDRPKQRMPAQSDWPSSGLIPDAQTKAIIADEYRRDPANLRAEVQQRYPDLLTSSESPGVLKSAIAALDDGGAPKASPATPKAVETPAPELRGIVPVAADLGKALLNQASGLGASILGGWRGLAAIAFGAGLEEASRQVHAPELPGGTTAQAYEPSGARAEAITKAAALPGEIIGAIGTRAGEATTDVTGSPAAGAAVTTGIAAAPLALVKRGAVARAEPKLVGSSSIAETKATPALTEATNLDIPTVFRQRQGVPLSEIGRPRTPLSLVPNEPRRMTPQEAVAEKPPLALEPNQPTPGRTGNAFDQPTPEAAAAQAAAEAPKFADSAPSAPEGKVLPAAEQQRRAQVLRDVGITEARSSAVKGDPKAASTDFQTSRLDNAAGNYMRSVLDNERGALTGHAEQIVRETGGSLGTDAHALETRGHAILSPLEGFRQWFTDQTTGLYNEARAKAGGQPVELGNFRSLLAEDSKFSGTDTLNLRKGIQARMKELKMVDADGNMLPATVEQAENLRKYVNEEWTPQSNLRVRELKNALDSDVTSAAGEDTFKKARALHAMKESIFSDPKGLSSILDSEGINRKIAIEKIPDAIAALPNAQFAHIVKTLRSVPPELQAQAQAALAEIKAQFANKVLDAGSGRIGQWGARDVTQFLNKNSAKLPLIFDAGELAKLKNLNDAGQILAKDQSYPGAAVQEHNLVRRGAMGAIRSGFAATGAFIGGPIGAAALDMVGSSLAGKFGEAAGLKATQKRVVKLSEFPK